MRCRTSKKTQKNSYRLHRLCMLMRQRSSHEVDLPALIHNTYIITHHWADLKTESTLQVVASKRRCDRNSTNQLQKKVQVPTMTYGVCGIYGIYGIYGIHGVYGTVASYGHNSNNPPCHFCHFCLGSELWSSRRPTSSWRTASVNKPWTKTSNYTATPRR